MRRSPPLPEPPPPVRLPPPGTKPAGWYEDPWQITAWRWWDGSQWTPHTTRPSGPNTTAVTDASDAKPRLPSFLSIPVLISAIPGVSLIVAGAILVPLAIALGLVPLLIVAPALIWMDRVEPEPWSARLHAFLWGAFVAAAVSIIVNTIVATATNDTVAAVLSAPIIEESMKALAIVWALRRKEVDGVMDGLVYAGWAALGFAVIENFLYFFNADGEDLLFETFIARAVFTPFAHPLFTAWTGLAIGLSVKRRASLASAWWGLALAIITHALWNGSLTLAEDESTAVVAGVVIVGFALLFFSTVLAVMVLRRRDRRRLTALAPFLADRYDLPTDRIAQLTDRKLRRSTRRGLARADRRSFDREASSVARLAALFDHPGTPDPTDEARLVTQLRATEHAA